jgi:nucleoside 2-deoxyribosyltransferase
MDADGSAVKVYLAGPMSGIKDFNFPAFGKAAQRLRNHGYNVFSPAEEDLRKWGTVEETQKHATYRECLRTDLLYIFDEADAVALLPGWEDSKGARLERDLALILGLEVIYLVD